MFINRVSHTALLLCIHLSSVYGACTLPSELNGTWWDSRVNKEVVFTQSTGNVPSGWRITRLSHVFPTFTCVESDSTRWLFRSDDSITLFGGPVYLFLCLRYTKLTDNSYSYYLDGDFDDQSSTRAALLSDDGSTISDGCSPTSGPNAEEFHVLVKENQQANVKQYFPNAILGVYAYNVTDSSSTNFCGSGSVWDACTNRDTMKLNYTQCSENLFGSTGGELYATHSVTSGSTTYVVVINGDSSLASPNIFTCLAVSGIYVSSNPGSCEVGQTATSYTSSSSSVLIWLSAYELCPFTSDSSSNAGLIAGLVIVFLLIAGGVVAFIVYFKVIKKKPFPCEKPKIHNGSEENAEKIPPDVVVESLSITEEDTNSSPEKTQPLPATNKPAPKTKARKNKRLPPIKRK